MVQYMPELVDDRQVRVLRTWVQAQPQGAALPSILVPADLPSATSSADRNRGQVAVTMNRIDCRESLPHGSESGALGNLHDRPDGTTRRLSSHIFACRRLDQDAHRVFEDALEELEEAGAVGAVEDAVVDGEGQAHLLADGDLAVLDD